MTGRIVVGGEALVDLVPAPRDTTSGSDAAPAGPLAALHPRLGGGPFNTAVGLARLGVDVSLLTRLSPDAFGDALAARLDGEGVDDALVQRGPEPSTLAVVTVSDSGGARYSFHVAGAADREVTDPGDLPDDTVALAVGTLSLVLEPGASVYTALALRAAARGRFVSLDPNVRPSLAVDAAALRGRLDALAAVAGLVKLSDEDAQWWGRDPEDLLDGGAAAVVLTRGADGLGARTRAAGRVDVPAARGHPLVDTIGAGDSVHAALLAWCHHHDLLGPGRLAGLDAAGWAAGLGYAAAAAAITCSRAGAEPPYASELSGPAGLPDLPPGSAERPTRRT